MARRHSIFGELERFLSPYGIGVMDATPVDVCLFVDSEYQHKHSGTMLPDGSHISAQQSLSNARSALAGVFNQQGRSGPWSDTDGSGNPCDSVHVKQYLAGYRNKQTAAGYAERAAVPYSEDELRQAMTASPQLTTSPSSPPPATPWRRLQMNPLSPYMVLLSPPFACSP